MYGFAAGGIATVIGSPFDVILVNMQSNSSKYNSLLSTGTKIYLNDGWLGFYKGFSFTFSRAIVVTASQFAVFEQIKQELTNINDNTLKFLISSISSSVVTSFISNPIDVCCGA